MSDILRIQRKIQWNIYHPDSHTVFYLFIYFLIYNIVLVLPYIDMNPPRVYMCSPSWTPLPPLSPYHPSGSSQCFFDDPADVGNLISGSSAFSKTSLNLWKFTVHILLKPGLENFEHYFSSVWDECNCAVVWAFFGIAFLWDWNENGPFPVLWPLLSFPNLLT